jgi:hypothetical protein
MKQRVTHLWELIARPFVWLRARVTTFVSRLRMPTALVTLSLWVSRVSGSLWRPCFLLASVLCVLAGILVALGADRPSLFSIYSAGLLAGFGVVFGLFALPTTEHAAREAEELI